MKFSILRSNRNITVALLGLALTVVTVSLIVGALNPSAPTEPDYETILPPETTIEDLGGWKLSSPPNNDPVFSYNDSIDSITVSVSQQPIPKSFEGDIENKVKELAKQNNATTEIEAGDITAFVGTSAKGPQSAIFVKNNLLVFIKSQEKISNESWSSYIESLN